MAKVLFTSDEKRQYSVKLPKTVECTELQLLAHLAMPQMSLYDHHLSLVSLVSLLLASASVDS